MPSKASTKPASSASAGPSEFPSDAQSGPVGAGVASAGLNSAPPSYEAALAELDALVAHMEAGQLPLDQLLVSYQRGAALLAYCRARLAAVEEQVKVLEDGQLKAWVGAQAA